MKNSCFNIFITCLIAVLVLASCGDDAPSAGGGRWKRKADFPSLGSTSAPFFVIGTKAYVKPNKLMQYDQANDTWTEKGYTPAGAGVQQAFAFVIGSKAYVGTGVPGAAAYLKKVFEYDQTSNTWTQKNDFPGGPRAGSAAFSINGKGYVVAGELDGLTYFNDVWEYTPSTDSWIKKSDFPGKPRTLGVSFVIGDKAYYGTGQTRENNSSISLKDFYEYTPATDTWVKKSDFAGEERYQAMGFAIGNRGYLGTGVGLSDYKDDFWEYNPGSDKWIPKANTSAKRFDSFGFAIGNKGYVSGGYGHIGEEYDLNALTTFFWEYSPQ